MEEILNEIQEAEKVDFDNLDFGKLHFTQEPLKGGEKLAIMWDNDTSYVDEGYIFFLPGQAADEYDFIVHIPNPINRGGFDSSPPVWKHILNLLSNDRVTEMDFDF